MPLTLPLVALLLAADPTALAPSAEPPEIVAAPGAAAPGAQEAPSSTPPPLPDPAHLAELVERARALRLAEEKGWLRLGHYQRRLRGGYESQTDGASFFLSPRGKRDPAAELEATLVALFDATPRIDELDDAQCRFPARLEWLTRTLGIDPTRLPRRPCPRYEHFRDQIRPQGATLVFSSYYLNNPSSAFGHTLLRLDKAAGAGGGEREELLDYGIDYAASVDTGNALLYAVKGLFGLFKGEFKYYAYYYKVRQYGDYESRDLWEYDLALEPDEVALLAAHVWELGGTWFDYWYLDENCSYHVLGALEAAAPRLDLLSGFRGNVIVLPSDTVRALFRNEGLVRDVRYRPSIRTQLDTRIAALPRAHHGLVAGLSRSPGTPLDPALPAAERAAILDAALDLVDLRHARGLLLGEDPAAAALRQALLVRRAALGVPSAALEIPPPEAQRVERGHGSLRIGVGGGGDRALGGAVLLDYRLALHDLADPLEGYPPYAQIEFLPTRLRWLPREGRLELDEWSLVRIVSLNPASRFDARPSWRARFGATTVRDAGCAGCVAGIADIGGGFAAAGLLGGLDLLATTDVELLVSPRLEGAAGSWLRPGVGPTGTARIRLGGAATFLADARWRFLPAAEPRTSWALGATLRLHLARDLSLALEARHTPRTTDAGALVLGFF